MAGNFSGYYCVLANVSDHQLLCIQSGSQDENASVITFVDQGPERFVDPADYSRFEPKQPLDSQQWLMIWMPQQSAYKLINHKSGLLLCVEGRSQDENHALIQYRDQNLSFQWWQVQDLGNGQFKLANINSGKVLTAASGSDSVVQQTSNPHSQLQQWNITSLVNSGYVGEYQIQNVNATKLLCILYRSIDHEAKAIIYEDQDLNFQWWRLFVHGWDNGAFEIQNVQSGKLLCMEARSTSEDVDAIQYEDQELLFQKWQLSLVPGPGASDAIKITNANSSLLLCVEGRATSNESQVIQYHDQGLSFQWWKFIKLSGDMDLVELIRFYNSPPKKVSRRLLQAADVDAGMCPELLLWYQNFIQTFALEVLGLMGVLPTPSREDLAAIANLVVGDPSVFGQVQVILGAAITVHTVVSMLSLFWEKNLWSEIFRLLLKKIWSLPTLVRATAFVASWITGAETYLTAIKITKTVAILALLYAEKPDCKQ